MHIVIGLGNYGDEYQNTRHNIGWSVIDRCACQYSIKLSQCRCNALVGEGFWNDYQIILVKPLTYMNLSGESVRELVKFYGTNNIIVVYDDVSIPVGRLRVRIKGNSGGHNGIKNVINELRTDKFTRIKVGIGAPSEGVSMATYVLGQFTVQENEVLDLVVPVVQSAIEDIINNGIGSAMNKFNGLNLAI